MKCLYCGKELAQNEHYWHKICLKSFFGVEQMPDIDNEQIKQHMLEQANLLLDKKAAITGVQEKLSVGLSKDKSKLTVFNYPKGFIIKPENKTFKNIARAEHLVMSMANDVGIKTALHGLLPLDESTYIYITKRIDRNEQEKIHMEDMCQLSNKVTEYKYDGSYEKLGKEIYRFTRSSVADIVEYYYRLMFCYVSCNSDMHLKNFSLIESDDIYLSPAYDLLPVNIIYPKDKEETALTINGKKKNITRNDFIKLAQSLNISEVTIDRLFKNLYSFKDKLIEDIEDSLLDKETKQKFLMEFKKRIELFA